MRHQAILTQCFSLALLITTVSSIPHKSTNSPNDKNNQSCPSGWDLSLITRKCYRLFNRPMPQSFAAKYCLGIDAQAKLVRIRDAIENAVVREFTYAGAIWLDTKAHATLQGSTYRWGNGHTAHFANWQSSNPDAQSGLCATMNTRGKWEPTDCDASFNVVCERKPARAKEHQSQPCPKKWLYNLHTLACYRIYVAPANVTWLDGDKLCGKAGSSVTSSASPSTNHRHHNPSNAAPRSDTALVTITSAAENQFVQDYARRRQPSWQHIFLGGLGDVRNKGHWDWVDGTHLDYVNWQPGYPRGGRRSAVLAMNVFGRWMNVHADRPLIGGPTVVMCKFSLL